MLSGTTPGLIASVASWHGGPLAGTDTVDAVEAVARAARGDAGGLRLLYAAFARRVQAAAMRVLGNSAEAEDVAQDVFVEIWRRAREYDPGRGSVPAWILTIARSRALNRQSSLKSATRTAESAAGEPAAAPPVEGEAALHRAQHRDRLANALATLPAEQRVVIELAYFEGLSQSEIAARTGDPLGTVKTRVRLGMEKLGALLGAGGGP